MNCEKFLRYVLLLGFALITACVTESGLGHIAVPPKTTAGYIGPGKPT